MIQLINKGKSYCNLNSIIHLSTVDWHGHSSITLFLNGCSFNCQYCYNSSCLNSNRKVLLINIYSEILKSKPYISSVVFLGGEPLNQLEIIIKIAAFSKRNNLLVGLHTNGSNTTNINTLIQLKLIDKYFIDIKAPFNYIKYLKVINIKQKTYSKINKIILNIQNSIKLIDLSTSQLELKTTIFPSIIGTKNEIQSIATWINQNIIFNNKTTYVLQQGLTKDTLNQKLSTLKSCNDDKIKYQGLIAKQILKKMKIFIRTEQYGRDEIIIM